MPQTKNIGFTLIELSIVIVIIGLIIGGVLFGRDLIKAAEIRSQIQQIEQIETEINTFKLKYNCLPGDCATATDFFGTSFEGNIIYNGNGNGAINAQYVNGSALNQEDECQAQSIGGEISQLFLLTYIAGIGRYKVSGILNPSGASKVGEDYPYAKYGNGTGIFVSCLSTHVTAGNITPLFLNTGNIIVVGNNGTATGDRNRIFYSTGALGAVRGFYGGYVNISDGINPTGIPTDVARQIDEKTDDGNPSNGRFGIIAGETACDNAYNTRFGLPLLTAYPAPSTACSTTVGKRID